MPLFQELRGQVELCEFKVSLVYHSKFQAMQVGTSHIPREVLNHE